MKSKYDFEKPLTGRKLLEKLCSQYNLFSIGIVTLWDLFINDHLEKEETSLERIETKW